MAASSFPLSSAFERTNQWVFSQDIPSDITIVVGEAAFSLHKIMLVPKSGYVKRKVMESELADHSSIDLSEVPGGAAAFEKVAKFCYSVNFEISVHNVAALCCAAEFLEMTEENYRGNLAARAEDFISKAALKTLPGAVAVLRSCEGTLFDLAEELMIVQRCVDSVGLKACNEANFPTRSPADWWAGVLATLGPASFQKVLTAMRSRGVAPRILATAVTTYAQKAFPELLPLSGVAVDISAAYTSIDADSRQRGLIEALVSLLPPDCDAPLPVGFLCCILRAAIFLEASAACRRDLERRISAALDQATVADLLAFTLDYASERIADLDSARRIVRGFVERETEGGGAGALYGGGVACCSAAAQKVARTMDALICEIATDEDLPVSKFAGIAGALPKTARRFDDDLYRAVDIYLKAHPGLDEIEREKVCSVMDPLRLSYEARLHASQNKRLPLQIVLHALYYDQLKLRSTGADGGGLEAAAGAGTVARSQAKAEVSLLKENDALRSELSRMKTYVSEMHRGQGSSGKAAKALPPSKKTAGTFFSSVSRTIGKLIHFKHGTKDDTLAAIVDDEEKVDMTKPRKRRFSIS